AVELIRAQAEMNAIAARLDQQYPEANTGVTIKVAPLQENQVGHARRALLLLFGAVGCLLLIACANVANLLLARATGRQKEIAIRLALGATRRQIIRQLLAESLLLALMGGCAGLLIAKWGIESMIALSADSLPRAGEVTLDGAAL